jgi:hypothetical protein
VFKRGVFKMLLKAVITCGCGRFYTIDSRINLTATEFYFDDLSLCLPQQEIRQESLT